MGTSAEWADAQAKNIIVMTFEGRWTLDEYHIVVDKAKQMVQESDQVADIVVDLRRSASIPNGVVQHQSKLAKNPINTGVTVLVGVNMLVQVMDNIMRRLHAKVMERVYLVKTMDEAYALIETHRAARQAAVTAPPK